MAVEKDKVINDVKGVTLTSLIPNFDVINSFVPEYMHCVLLGIVRLFLSAWLDSQMKDKLFYIGTKSHILEQRLLSIEPTSEMTRIPQTLGNICQWKAL